MFLSCKKLEQRSFGHFSNLYDILFYKVVARAFLCRSTSLLRSYCWQLTASHRFHFAAWYVRAHTLSPHIFKCEKYAAIMAITYLTLCGGRVRAPTSVATQQSDAILHVDLKTSKQLICYSWFVFLQLNAWSNKSMSRIEVLLPDCSSFNAKKVCIILFIVISIKKWLFLSAQRQNIMHCSMFSNSHFLMWLNVFYIA